jgi:Mce-associated membrane protein
MTRARLVVVLLVLVVLVSGLSVVLALTRPDLEAAGAEPMVTGGRYEPAELGGPGGEAVAAAVEAVPLTLTVDHRDLRGSLAAATERMTPAFARAYTDDFDRTSRPFARERRAVTDAVVLGAGVVRARGDDDVVCLVYVDQRQVSGEGVQPGDQPRVLLRGRVLVRMVRRDGQWLVDGTQSL